MEIDRRALIKHSVLTGAGFSLLGLVTFLGGPPAYEAYRNRYTKEQMDAVIADTKKRITDRHGVAVGIKEQEIIKFIGGIGFKSEDSTFIQMIALEEFERLLSLYPPMMLATFAPKVQITGKNINGKVGGVFALDKSILSVSIYGLLNSISAVWRNSVLSERNVHHEIAHALTLPFFTTEKHVVAWKKLNPEDVYEGLYVQPQEEPECIPGFAHSYGLRAPAEDMATVAEVLFQGDAQVAKMLKLQNDNTSLENPWRGVLHKKIGKIKEYYFVQSKGLIDEGFWFLIDAIKQGRRPEDQAVLWRTYWDDKKNSLGNSWPF